MTEYTRRRFLRRAAASLGLFAAGGMLTACGREAMRLATATSAGADSTPSVPPTAAPTARPAGEPTASRPADVSEPSPTSRAVETSTPSPTSTPERSPSHPDLVVARGGEPEEMVRRALAALGGMERFVNAGDDVVIKPNICVAYHTHEYAATTNPWVVAALVKLALESGARRVRVMDYPFGGSAEQAYVKSGIQEQVEKAGGQMEVMRRLEYVTVDIPEGLDLKRCLVYDPVLKADVLIDVPIAKHHNLAGLTLGMKNLMGVILDRPAMHSNLGQRLADLSTRVQPTLTVVDAVRMLMDHGPTGGNLDDVREAQTVIASSDIVAADSYAATLFDMRPDELSYVRAAAAMGLGASDLESLQIEEIAVAG